jgi:hypothetical protein
MVHEVYIACSTAYCCLARYDLICRSKWSSRVVQVQVSDKRRDVQCARNKQQFREYASI